MRLSLLILAGALLLAVSCGQVVVVDAACTDAEVEYVERMTDDVQSGITALQSLETVLSEVRGDMEQWDEDKVVQAAFTIYGQSSDNPLRRASPTSRTDIAHADIAGFMYQIELVKETVALSAARASRSESKRPALTQVLLALEHTQEAIRVGEVSMGSLASRCPARA